MGDQCNIVQCIVRGVCSGDPNIPCSVDATCNAAVAGVCQQSSFRQRCDVVQLIGERCDADTDFCTMDQCEDDGGGTSGPLDFGEIFSQHNHCGAEESD